MGSAKISAPAVKRNIGYLPEGAYYPNFLKGEEILRFYGQLYGLSGADLKARIDKVLDQVGMSHARKRLLGGYSKGMRQRIGLAQALISDPQILILDEPTVGLDPIARKEIRDILANLRDQGKTILITSHELLEVEMISDRVGVLYDGVLQTIGTMRELLINREMVLEVSGVTQEALSGFEARGIVLEDRMEDRVRLRIPDEMNHYDALAMCRERNLSLVSVAPRRETLEELFVRIVGKAESERSKS
jgi:ABC-2 type transport system ATP-binding protein